MTLLPKLEDLPVLGPALEYVLGPAGPGLAVVVLIVILMRIPLAFRGGRGRGGRRSRGGGWRGGGGGFGGGGASGGW